MVSCQTKFYVKKKKGILLVACYFRCQSRKNQRFFLKFWHVIGKENKNKYFINISLRYKYWKAYLLSSKKSSDYNKTSIDTCKNNLCLWDCK